MNSEYIDNLPEGWEIDELIEKHIFGKDYVRGFRISDYSTDISEAWTIIDYIKDRDWRFILDRDDTGWSIEIELSGTKEGSFACGAIAQTAPLAICRAILKTVENK